MIDSKSGGRETEAPSAGRLWMQRGILAAVCALVIGVYVYAAHSVPPGASDDYYNLLVQGFRAGQLNLKKEVPPGLAQLADPYGPEAFLFYYHEVGDMSYYKGKLYLYFGVTPAVVLFWPYVALTGHYLQQRDGIVVFCVAGFLVSAGLLRVVWRRYFGEVSVWVMALGTLALGLAIGAPLVLTRCEVHEVPIMCGYALTMLGLATIWKALHESRKRSGCRWLAAASLACGLAVGARPNLLFGAVILLVPVLHAWRERRKIGALLLAATGPILLIGLGLMLYNALRFDSPFKFGQRYQINDHEQLTQQFFSLRYVWFNFRVYFLEPVRWGHRYPFVHEIRVPALPAGHGLAEQPFGVLTNTPLVWLALAVPLAWRGRSPEVHSTLREILLAVAVLFGICTLILCLFSGACTRYEMEFLPELMLLAVVGILSVERALAPISESGQAGRTVWRRAACGGWCLLLGFSVAFNLFASIKRCAENHNDMGYTLFRQGKVQEAIGHYEQALLIMPDYGDAHYNLGNALEKAGRLQEAVGHYKQALRTNPEYAGAHNNLGDALERSGHTQEAIQHYKQALRISPGLAQAHYNWAVALQGVGQMQQASRHYEQALQAQPDFAEAHNNLGAVLMGQGRLQEAVGHYEQALRTDPEYAEAHNNLALALLQLGRLTEAIEHWEQALRIKPNYAGAHYKLGLALAQAGRVQEAISHYEQAVRLQPDFADACNSLAWQLATHPPAQGGDATRAMALALRACEITGNSRPGYLDTLAAAYAAAGRFGEAIATAEKAIELARAAAPAKSVGAFEARLELYRSGHAYFQPVGEAGR